ncbi:outer membrane protein [Altererythrobacter lauratis]|uniref:Outer membrane protein n=1 Tax=Alteraurantiacibacter lauratis TaxID=2054627 RepID=A0ABV7EGB2_9SPHN
MFTKRFQRIALASGAALAALAVPAAAQANDFYVGVSGGIAFTQNSANSGEFDTTVPATANWPAIPAGTSLGWRTSFDNGLALSGVAGIATDSGIRAEVELAYSRNGIDTHRGLAVGGTVIDNLDSAVLTRGAPNANNPTVGALIDDGEGNVSNLGVFGNVFYDIPTGGGVTPYLGAGLGYVNTDVKYRPSGVGVADESDDGFAWQAMAGVSLALSQNADFFSQYTYRSRFKDAKVGLDLLPATLGVELDQSIVTAGVRLRFGQ